MVGSGGLKEPNDGQCRTKRTGRWAVQAKKDRMVGSAGLKGLVGGQCRNKRTEWWAVQD
jgi:hypothetical protein